MKIDRSNHIAQAQTHSKIPDEYLQLAKGMDSQFMEHLFQEMEKTVHREDGESTAQEIYRSLLNHERAKTMAEKNTGKGIQKLILDEIAPRNVRF